MNTTEEVLGLGPHSEPADRRACEAVVAAASALVAPARRRAAR